MNADHTTPLAAIDDELYVELVPGYRVAQHTVTFPAVVDEHRRQGMWAQPCFRRETAEALAEWLNLVYPLDPDWYPLARFDGATLLIICGESTRDWHAIEPDDEGRYRLGSEGGCWFLSIPTRTTAAELHELERLCDHTLRAPADGEALVSCDPDAHLIGAFPARVETRQHQSGLVPTFRAEVAEAVVAWCNSRHRAEPSLYPQAYFDDGTLVHVHQDLRALDGYVPWRIAPDQAGRYRISSEGWAFHLASDGVTTHVPTVASHA